MKYIQEEIINNITPEIKAEMETIWFTADLHADHTKIVEIYNRPININKNDLIGIGEHNISNPSYKRLVNEANNNWIIKDVINKYVKKTDDLYILGDVTMSNKKNADKFIDRLNGNKHLISGNHDKNIKHSTRFSEITQIKDFRFKRDNIDITIILCHYNMLSWNKRIHGSWHLFGHTHCRPIEGQAIMSFDVGIDRIGIYRPYNLYEICQIMYQKSKGISEEKILKSL